MVMNRCSLSECSTSVNVADKGSYSTVTASSNDTPCLRRFRRAFFPSHSHCINQSYSSHCSNFEVQGVRFWSRTSMLAMHIS